MLTGMARDDDDYDECATSSSTSSALPTDKEDHGSSYLSPTALIGLYADTFTCHDFRYTKGCQKSVLTVFLTVTVCLSFHKSFQNML